MGFEMKQTADGVFLSRAEHDALLGKPLLEVLIGESPTYKWNLGGVTISGITPMMVQSLNEFFKEKSSEEKPKPIEDAIKPPSPEDLRDSGFTEEEIEGEFGGVRTASEEPLSGLLSVGELDLGKNEPISRWDLPDEIRL